MQDILSRVAMARALHCIRIPLISHSCSASCCSRGECYDFGLPSIESIDCKASLDLDQ